jgi:hypothetical protein
MISLANIFCFPILDNTLFFYKKNLTVFKKSVLYLFPGTPARGHIVPNGIRLSIAASPFSVNFIRASWKMAARPYFLSHT